MPCGITSLLICVVMRLNRARIYRIDHKSTKSRSQEVQKSRSHDERVVVRIHCVSLRYVVRIVRAHSVSLSTCIVMSFSSAGDLWPQMQLHRAGHLAWNSQRPHSPPACRRVPPSRHPSTTSPNPHGAAPSRRVRSQPRSQAPSGRF
jgi:hypothetical protein